MRSHFFDVIVLCVIIAILLWPDWVGQQLATFLRAASHAR